MAGTGASLVSETLRLAVYYEGVFLGMARDTTAAIRRLASEIGRVKLHSLARRRGKLRFDQQIRFETLPTLVDTSVPLDTRTQRVILGKITFDE